MKNVKTVKRLIAVVVVMVLAASAAAALVYRRVTQPYRGFQGAEQFVDIPPGAGSRGIRERLVAGGVIRDATTFRIALWMSGEGRRLKAGEYRFDREMTPFDVIDKLARTVRETLASNEVIATLASQGFEPLSGGPQDFTRTIGTESKRWTEVAQAAGLKQ